MKKHGWVGWLIVACAGLAHAQDAATPAPLPAPQPLAGDEVAFSAVPAQLAYPGTMVLSPLVRSGTTFTVSSFTPAVCSVSTFLRDQFAVTARSPGTCTVWIKARGSYAGMTFNVVRSPQVLGVYFPAPEPWQPRLVQVVRRTSPTEPVALSSTTPEICALGAARQDASGVVSAPVITLQPGVCGVKAVQAASGAFSAGEAARSVDLAQAPASTLAGTDAVQVITLDMPASVPRNASAQVVVRGGDSGRPVVLVSQTPQNCTLQDLTTVVGLAEGPCVLSASQEGAAGFAPAAAVSASAPVVTPPTAFAALVRVTGGADAQTIKAELFPDYTDLGQAGSVFIGVVVNGAITLLGAQGWTPYDGGPAPAPYASGPLQPVQLAVVAGADVRPLVGANLFVGYGRGASREAAYLDMLAQGRLVFAHQVAP